MPRDTLVHEIHAEQSKGPKHLKGFWGHCRSEKDKESTLQATLLDPHLRIEGVLDVVEPNNLGIVTVFL